MNDELLRFYGLTRDPFAPAADATELLAAESQGQFVHQLLTDVAAEPGVVTVRGDAGVGKTSVSRLVALALRNHGVLVVELAAGRHSALQMQGLIGEAAGIGGSEQLTPDQLARELPGRLGRAGLALVVDDAHRLPDTAYHYLLLLRAALAFSNVGFGLVLVGAPGHWPGMEASDLAGLQPEGVARHVIFPLREEEAADLLDLKFRQAGRKARDVLSGSAALALVREAEGVPARLQSLAEAALVASHARRRRRATLRTVWPALSPGRGRTARLMLRSVRTPAIVVGCLVLAGAAAGGYVWQDELGLAAARLRLASVVDQATGWFQAQTPPPTVDEPAATPAPPPDLAQALPPAPVASTVIPPLPSPAAATDTPGPEPRPREAHGSPGLILVAGPDDTLPALYARVYRGITPPPYAAVVAANRSPIHAGALLVFPEPPNGWSKR